jgi:hypothetical protein
MQTSAKTADGKPVEDSRQKTENLREAPLLQEAGFNCSQSSVLRLLRPPIRTYNFYKFIGKTYIFIGLLSNIPMYAYRNISDEKHYPTLKTMLMIEDTLKNADLVMSKAELMRRLPKKVMDSTLNIALDYLEDRGMITTSRKGILWTYNPSPKLAKAIAEGREI